MFVFEKNGAICVSFKHNQPTDTPDYVIVFDEVNKAVVVNGKPVSADTPAEETPAPEVVETPAPKATRKSKQVVEPTVEETATEVTEVTAE